MTTISPIGDGHGQLTFDVCDDLRCELLAALEAMPDGACLTLDFSAIDRVDSTALAVLVAMAQTCSQERPSSTIRFINTNDFIKRTLALIGLERSGNVTIELGMDSNA